MWREIRHTENKKKKGDIMKKRIFALLLCVLMVLTCLSLAGCKKNPDNDEISEYSDYTDVESVPEETESVQETASEEEKDTSSKQPTKTSTKKPSAGVLNNTTASEKELFPSKWTPTKSVSELPTIYKEKGASGTISYLGSEKISDETFKKYAKYFKEMTGKDLDVKYTLTSWGNVPTQLQTMVYAKKSPDYVMPLYQGVTVYLRNKGLLRNINDFINLNDAAFLPVRDYNGIMFYEGEMKAVGLNYPSLVGNLIYNKNMIRAAGLADPWELFKKGEWTSDKLFGEYLEKLTVVKNGVTQVYGVSMMHSNVMFLGISGAKGNDIVKINSKGRFVNNLDDPAWARYAGYCKKMGDMKAYDPLCVTQNNVVNGTAAIGIYHNPEDPAEVKMKKAGNLGYVPYPRDPSDTKHYLYMELGYAMLPINSSNPWGGAALAYAARLENEATFTDTEARVKKFLDYGYPQDEAEFRAYGYTKHPAAFTFWDNMADFNYSSLSEIIGTDWAVVKEKVSPILDRALEQENG